MQRSLYSNPAFGAGLADIVKGFVGSPQATAQAELMASQAGLNNGTIAYREQIGKEGMEGNLQGLLVRALQAGKEYSSEAPTIASSLASLPGSGYSTREQGNIQVGTGTQTAKNTFSGLAQVLANSRSGRRGGGGGGGSKPKSVKPLTAGGRTLLMKSLGKDVDPAVASSIVSQTESLLGEMGENQAIEYALNNLDREDVVTNLGGTKLSRALAGVGWGDPDSWEPDEVDVGAGPIVGIRAPGAGKTEGLASTLPSGDNSVLEEARNAIAAGADPAAVKKRLKDMGISGDL